MCSNRAVQLGAATGNDTHYEVHGVNLGKLPAGKYAVKWIIRNSTFTGLGKDGSPEDIKPTKSEEVKTSFQVQPARKPELQNSAKEKGGDAGSVYEDKARGFCLTNPKGWSATPVSYSVQHYRDIFLCINSKGNKALRVINERKGDTERYNPDTVAAQLAPGMVYIDVAIFDGPGGEINFKGKADTVANDLQPLLKSIKFVKAAGGKPSMLELSFIKREHLWHIYVFLREPVNAQLRAKAEALLRSFRFIDKPGPP